MNNRIARNLLALILIAAVFAGALPGMPVEAADNSNVILDIPWEKINKCGHQAVSGPCQAYCWAYCRIILDNQEHNYSDYYIRGVGGVAPSTAGYNNGQSAQSVNELLKIVYDNINQGRPVMLRVVGSYAYHFIVAVGYRSDSDPNNLKTSDILILDPASKSIKRDAGSTQTYTYLDSRTISGNRYWTAKSGGVSVMSGSEEQPTCSNHTYDAETCTVCGAVLNYDNGFNSSAAGKYEVTADTAYVRTGPYQAKDLVRTMSKGETVQAVGTVINSYGNTWLKTSEGYYIHADKMSKKETSVEKEGHWTQWSDWSANYVEASDTRQVEIQQNMVTEGRTEYRYGRYVDSTGTHDCWCSTYLEHLRGVTGSAILDYSDWSTTQYSPARPHWTCGFCNGNHINVDHYSDDGRAWWKQYILPTGSYYWEESRWVEPVYETQYRYRDLITG